MAQTAQKPIERVIEALGQLTQVGKMYPGGYYMVPCIAHGGRNRNLQIREDEDGHVILKCYSAGCETKAIVEKLGLTMSDLFPQDASNGHRPRNTTLSTSELSEAKTIDPRLFFKWGIRDGAMTFHTREGKPYQRKGVIVPYYNMDGAQYRRVRLRVALEGERRFYWDEAKEPLIPYGLHRLEEARKAGYLVIVEGESDCWTLWMKKFPALGIPGATNTGALQKEHLEGIGKLYIVQEPPSEEDKAKGKDPGAKFVADLKARLRDIGWQGNVYSIDFQATTSTKDPNELLQRDIPGFQTAFQSALERAEKGVEQAQEDCIDRVHDLASYLARPHTPLTWVIPDLLPEGATVVMGESKGGKSIFTAGIGWACATKGTVLGMYTAEQLNRTLYINLDESEDEFRDKLFGVAGGKDLIESMDLSAIPFHIVHEWPVMQDGGMGALERWMQRYPDTKVIIIDCLMAFFHGVRGGKDIVQEDYHAIAQLREFASRYHIAVALIAHTRKSKTKGEDVFTRINGTQGLLAGATSLMVLDRPDREEPSAMLHITGRRIPDKKLKLTLLTQGVLMWQCEGNAKDISLSQSRITLLEVLRDYPNISLEDAARYAEKNMNTTRNLLTSLHEDGYVDRQLADNGRSGKYLFQLTLKGQQYLRELVEPKQTEPLPASQPNNHHNNGVVSIVSMVDSSKYGKYGKYGDTNTHLASNSPEQEQSSEPTILTILTTPTMLTTPSCELTMSPSEEETRVLEQVRGHGTSVHCNCDGCCPACGCRLERRVLGSWECLRCSPASTYSDAIMQMVNALPRLPRTS
jgi:RecA-family ATPase